MPYLELCVLILCTIIQIICVSLYLCYTETEIYHFRIFVVRFCLFVLRFNDMSTLVGHFVSSPREREKRDRRDSRRDERDELGRKRNRNESEETEEIKIFPLYPYLLQGQQALPNFKPISVGRPGDIRYTTPSHHPTTPCCKVHCTIKGPIIFICK